jgi:hypothetical protein
VGAANISAEVDFSGVKFHRTVWMRVLLEDCAGLKHYYCRKLYHVEVERLEQV